MKNIQLVIGDITTLHVDAIVNAANRTLLGGGGVDGAIHRAAGRGLFEECAKLGGCATGEAKITGSHNITNVKAIIHTVGPVYGGKATDAEALKKCYVNSLNLAKENGLHSIAFPSISTGVYGYPLKEAAEVSYKAVCGWLAANEDYPITVIFCCFHQGGYHVYQTVINENGGNV